MKSESHRTWSRVLLAIWLYTLLVILWGAWVHISHSGDGCGDHWPLCSGEFIPDFTNHKTWIEYTHRVMSGLYGLAVFAIFWGLRKNAEPLVRKLNFWLLSFTASEALLGAALVKGKLVTVDDSVLRLGVMSLHQINSFMLTGVGFLLYESWKTKRSQLSTQYLKWIILFALLPLTGAIAALATTLFPSLSLWQGILQDFAGNTHPFLRLRVLHPVLSILIAGGLVLWCFQKNLHRLGWQFLGGIADGLVTLLTLSPAYLKITHLLIAHLLWASLLYTLVSRPDSNKR